jgi:hypothetical protein
VHVCLRQAFIVRMLLGNGMVRQLWLARPSATAGYRADSAESRLNNKPGFPDTLGLKLFGRYMPALRRLVRAGSIWVGVCTCWELCCHDNSRFAYRCACLVC